MSVAPPPLRYRHASGLHAVARALDTLHRELLRDEGEDGAAVRTSVINIVAACTDPAEADAARDDLLQIGSRHPTRAIVVVAEPEGERVLEAEVSLHCAANSRHVCMELVRLHVQGDPALHLTSVVTPLLLPDVPVHLWAVGSPPLRQAFSEEAVTLTERIVIDSAAYPDARATLRLIAAQLEHYGEDLQIGDLSWERLRVWRQALAHAFDPPAVRPLLQGVESVVVRTARDATATESLLLGGWLASRLQWRDGLARVHVDTSAPRGAAPASVHVHVRAGGAAGVVTVARDGEALTASVDVPGVTQTTRALTVPVRDRADLIGEMVTAGTDDHVYRDAVAAAAGGDMQ